MITDLKSARKTTIESIKTSTRSFKKKNQMGRQHCALQDAGIDHFHFPKQLLHSIYDKMRTNKAMEFIGFELER